MTTEVRSGFASAQGDARGLRRAEGVREASAPPVGPDVLVEAVAHAQGVDLAHRDELVAHGHAEDAQVEAFLALGGRGSPPGS